MKRGVKIDLVDAIAELYSLWDKLLEISIELDGLAMMDMSVQTLTNCGLTKEEVQEINELSLNASETVKKIMDKLKAVRNELKEMLMEKVLKG